MLNSALFFLGVAATGFGTIAALPGDQRKVYYRFLIISVISVIAGTVLISVWFTLRRSVADLIAEIKAQMPPNPETELVPPGGASIVGDELHTSEGG